MIIWLPAWLLLLVPAVVFALPCSYQVPRVDDILLSVPLKESSRVRRATKSRPLRIYLHYDDSVRNLTEDKQLYINSSLLPDAAGFWERALNVRNPSLQPLRLRRKCVSSFYYFRSEKRSVACDKGCREITTCGEAVVPAEHLLECSYCLSADDCYNSGEIGSGVPGADFVLYVTAVHTNRCDNPDTLAYAAHCQQEAELDRPVAGHVNLCPDSLSTHDHDREILSSTVRHEMLHALGFSVGLFAFFRDKNGKPRTRRNRYGKPISLNRQSGYYDWDRNTVDTVLRDKWQTTGDGSTVIHPVHMLVTPRVREEARAHFNCDSLEGAELENQGGEGTALTHWEKRIFENEAMAGTHTQNPVYSRITLALLEDSGWYDPDYSVAETLHWGRDLGCEFVKRSCGEWIRSRKEKNLSPYPFCDEIKHDGKKSLAVTRCTAERDSLALCNLIPYKKPLPHQFRYFEHLPGVSSEGSSYYGGAVELADFCPYSQEFEWKLNNNTTRRDSRCELEGNNRDGEDILEVYGPNSMCFDFAQPWVERKCGRMRTLSHYMAGCYEKHCENGTLFIGVFNSTLYPCGREGQLVFVNQIIDGWLREGSLICPSCSSFCSECLPPIDYAFPIGDKPLVEPCACPPCVMSLVLLLLLCFVFPL